MNHPQDNTKVLKERLAEAIMQPWFDQFTEGFNGVGSQSTTTIKVKDTQVNKLYDLFTEVLTELLKEMDSKILYWTLENKKEYLDLLKEVGATEFPPDTLLAFQSGYNKAISECQRVIERNIK